MVELHEIIEDEVLIIRHSGEIPEVAFHGALYFLSEDPEGPCTVNLPDRYFMSLVDAVVERYRFIIIRDLTPRNRDKRIYRGVKRGVVNWKRLEKFASMYKVDLSGIREEVAVALNDFIVQEFDDVSCGEREPVINCSLEQVLEFSANLGVELAVSQELLREICRS